MRNKWKYKIELRDKDTFKRLSEEYNLIIPADLKEFVRKNNAAVPVANCVLVNGIERVYAETLSFNYKEEDATTVYSIIKIINNQNYIPFALDPFGNVFCYSVKTSTISFFDHEEKNIYETKMSLKVFVESLYKGAE